MSGLANICSKRWFNGESPVNVELTIAPFGRVNAAMVFLFIEYIYTGKASYKKAVFYPGAQWIKYVYN